VIAAKALEVPVELVDLTKDAVQLTEVHH
jgi:hypothetical protein